MYSGELEVKENEEKSELLAAASLFGFSNLVEGCKDGVNWQSTPSYKETYRSLKMQDVQVQVEMAVNKRNTPEKKSCASVGTQTVVLLDKKTAQVPFVVSFSSLSQCENAPVDNLMILNPPPINTSDGESEVGQSTNHKQFSALSCETDTFSVSLAGGSGLQSSQEQGCSQQLPEYEDNIQVERREEGANCKVMEYGAVSPHQEQGQGKGQMLGGKNKERTHSICKAGIKNLAKMKQMMGTTEISIKVRNLGSNLSIFPMKF